MTDVAGSGQPMCALRVSTIRARNLSTSSFFGGPNPYVTVTILNQRMKTKVKGGTQQDKVRSNLILSFHPVVISNQPSSPSSIHQPRPYPNPCSPTGEVEPQGGGLEAVRHGLHDTRSCPRLPPTGRARLRQRARAAKATAGRRQHSPSGGGPAASHRELVRTGGTHMHRIMT